DLTRLKEHYERKMKELMANTVGTVELQQLKQRHEQKMQKLVKAAREGTKDGLEKTKAAVKKGRSFIKTKSFCHERKSACFEDEETELFIEVDCFNVEPVLGPAPEGLSQQQLVRRCILGSILESEKNYLDALKRILEVEPRLLSDRKLKMIFHRVREILQCHFLFQIALASRVADWDNLEMIGDVFVASAAVRSPGLRPLASHQTTGLAVDGTQGVQAGLEPLCSLSGTGCSQDSIANASGNGSTSGNGSVSGMGSASSPGHKFLLKWSVPLGLADVVEFGSSEDAPDTGRPPAAHHHSGEKVVINAKP
ncbi:hypothetical protein CRUP_035036, partial [Coryphaenoides rupestris]